MWNRYIQIYTKDRWHGVEWAGKIKMEIEKLFPYLFLLEVEEKSASLIL